jgi:beta-galactosidase
VIYAAESGPYDAFDYWMSVQQYPWVIGDFVWAGLDYLGEAGIGWVGFSASDYFPWTVAFCGDIDITGEKRPQSYYRDVLWNTGAKVSAFVKAPSSTFEALATGWDRVWSWDDVWPSWTWPGYEGQSLTVHVYSACEQVDLLVNGQHIGTRTMSPSNKLRAIFTVPYEPGKLEATCIEGGVATASSTLTTAGRPATIKLLPDRDRIVADGQDLAYVRVEILDASGVLVPNTDVLVSLRLNGEGKLAAFGSAKPTSTESFQAPVRTTWQGRALAIVRSTRSPGTVTLTAEAEGLTGESISITTR